MKLDDKLHWYKDAIIYELHIKAFYDSNGDGIGDLKGLIAKLDLLVELGVTAIWVLPFYPSPLRDDGYDIADYYGINPSYGTIADFKDFLREAHKRELRVITELVLNHTSDQHPWFQRARRAPRDSNERAYYVWSDDALQYRDVRIIFQDFETSNWTWDEVAGQYYWHRFYHHQPDLNYDNPSVQEETFRIIDFWCRMGVDGFRIDAVPYLYEREGTNCENLPETHRFLKKLRAYVDEKFPGTMLLAEANMWPEEAAAYFGDGDECHANYHFPLMPRMYMALQAEDRHAITDIFQQTPPIPFTCQWAMFLRNHDELTLEMVTDEERDYMYRAYVRDQKARINLGIRHRLAPLMENDRRKIELMNSLLFSLPGTPVIYYGDEIGMGDNFYLGDRDGVRTPMQWSADRNAGFSGAEPGRLYLPVIQDPAYHYETTNVETQRANTSSLYWFMKRMISVRKKYKAFGRGDIRFLDVENSKVLVFTRSFENETLLMVVNLSKFTQPCEVDLREYAGYHPVEIFSRNRFPPISNNIPYLFTPGPYAYQWYYLFKEERKADDIHPNEIFNLDSEQDLLQSRQLRDLEKRLIPHYLEKVSWFGNQYNLFYDCQLDLYSTIPLKERQVYWFVLQVSFKSGLPESYHLPLAIVSETENNEICDRYPEAFIGNIRVGNHPGCLIDALYYPEFQHWLLNLGLKDANNEGEIRFQIEEKIRHMLAGASLQPRMHSDRLQSNSAITYNNQLFLKVYRKVQTGLHPDLEITEFLTREAGYLNCPAYYGKAELITAREYYPIALLQAMIENHGTSCSFMQERLQNYMERIHALSRSEIPETAILPSALTRIEAEALPALLSKLLGDRSTSHAALIGKRVAELHLALGSSERPAFAPESFSLHYQRSLYSAMRIPLREAYAMMQRKENSTSPDFRELIGPLKEREKDFDSTLRKLYNSKFDTVKIRIHGNLNLEQILFSGNDIYIHDFGGDPARHISERRIKRSCLRDVASLVLSFYTVAYESFSDPSLKWVASLGDVRRYAELWAAFHSGIMLDNYLKTMGETPLVPRSEAHRTTLLKAYLIEQSFHLLLREMQQRSEKAVIAARVILAI